MYCRNCGQPIDDNATVCQNCGAYQNKNPNVEDNGGIGWGLLGCCIPVRDWSCSWFGRILSPEQQRQLELVHWCQ